MTYGSAGGPLGIWSRAGFKPPRTAAALAALVAILAGCASAPGRGDGEDGCYLRRGFGEGRGLATVLDSTGLHAAMRPFDWSATVGKVVFTVDSARSSPPAGGEARSRVRVYGDGVTEEMASDLRARVESHLHPDDRLSLGGWVQLADSGRWDLVLLREVELCDPKLLTVDEMSEGLTGVVRGFSGMRDSRVRFDVLPDGSVTNFRFEEPPPDPRVEFGARALFARARFRPASVAGIPIRVPVAMNLMVR